MPAESGGATVFAEDREGERGVVGGTSLIVDVEEFLKFVNP